MKNSARFAVAVGLALALCGPVLAQKQAKAAENIAKGMIKFQGNLTSAKTQVDTVLKSLQDLTTASSPDVMKKYEVFVKEVKNTTDLKQDVQARAKEVNADRDKFVKAWSDDQKDIQNEDLRKAAESRQAELSPIVDRLKTAMSGAGETSAPFLQNMNDLVLFLGNDLSPAAMTAAAPLIGKCNDGGTKLQGDLDAGIAAVGELVTFFQPQGVK
ncbi:MAG TPA: DUF2959 family protein [Candidatus Polarisedimenticolia bacterium]|jgi:phosphoenolpyruvate-protein kinase (PTS system EI component)|nr:DUF2959 family protein [Candidatus Polarisedimenticolia bacterium]